MSRHRNLKDIEESSEPRPLPEALGQSEAFLAFQEQLSAVAPVERPVLIIGERGTGKELVASRLHYLSRRWRGPVVTLNCAALNPSVIESELFGHEVGAFTGASQRRRGRFEAASGGTLFLDEIGLIPMQVQEKILRVVEYGAFERVGGSSPVSVDVRIVGATNADLPAMVRRGDFKADLLDRLAFEVLKLPALRDRQEDIVLLAQHFAARMALELGRETIPTFSDSVIEALESFHWPGNVRELKNAVERAVYRCESDIIESVELNPFGSDWIVRDTVVEGSGGGDDGGSGTGETGGLQGLDENGVYHRFRFDDESLSESVARFECAAVAAALTATQFHQGEAAKRLGLTYHQFRTFYRKYRDQIGG